MIVFAIDLSLSHSHAVVMGRIKMSKRLKNYPDPMDVVHKFGADALRHALYCKTLIQHSSLMISCMTLNIVYAKSDDVITYLANHAYASV